MIKCAKCGYENELGHIFCTKCSAKLEFNPEMDKELFKSAKTGKRGLMLTVLILFILIAALSGLSLWPVRAPEKKGTTADFQRARKKLTLLERRVSTKPQIFSEKEVNKVLDAVLKRTKRTMGSGILTSKVKSVCIFLNPKAVKVSVTEVWRPFTIGPVNIGSLKTSYGLTGVPQFGENGFRFSVKGGQVGHLPLPGPLAYLVLPRAKVFFSRMKKEKMFLDRVSRINLEKEKMSLSMK